MSFLWASFASFEKQVGSVLATIVWRVRPVAESRRRSNAGLGELTPILLTFLGETERPFLGADLRSGAPAAEGRSRWLRRDPAARAQRGSWVEAVLTGSSRRRGLAAGGGG